jgi:hypothetical protein
MFYKYSQNNSGGYWNGPKNIIVEADSPEQADEIAEQNGVYFNGCFTGQDCSCCSNRWSRAWGDGDEKPEIYGIASDDYVIVFRN